MKFGDFRRNFGQRRESAVARVKERDSTVLGINLNYPDDRSEEERRLADLKNKRSLMTKRDASSPRKLCTWEMEGVPGQQPYQPRPVGHVAANKSLIWGDGNSHVKLYTNPETARLAAELPEGVLDLRRGLPGQLLWRLLPLRPRQLPPERWDPESG